MRILNDFELWDLINIILALVACTLFISFSIVVANNYIEWRQYGKDTKMYAQMYPATTMMNNGVQYNCTFSIPEPTFRINLGVDLDYWYIYVLCMIIWGITLFVAIMFIPTIFRYRD